MFTFKDIPTRRLAASAGAAAVLLVGALAPTAGAEPADAQQNCILITELDRELCAPAREDLHAKVLEETGLTVIETTSAGAAARLAADAGVARATYVIARLYDDSGYGGGVKEITSTSTCNGTTVKSVSDIGSSWYGRVSSFGTYSGCTVKIYASTGFGGDSYGYAGSTSYVGSTMNDRTRSLQAK